MLRAVTRSMLIACFVAVFALPSAAIASSGSQMNDYLNEATRSLQSSKLYVSPLVTGFDTADQRQLLAIIGESSIAVTVLPEQSLGVAVGGDPSVFITAVAQRTGYSTVVMSVGTRLYAGSSVISPDRVSSLADNASGTSTFDRLADFVQSVRVDNATPNQEPSLDESGYPVWLIVLFVMFVIGALWFLVLVIRRWQISRHDGRLTLQKGLAELYDRSLALSAEFQDCRDVHAKLAQSRNDLGALMNRLIKAKDQESTPAVEAYAKQLGAILELLQTYHNVKNDPEYYDLSDGEVLRSVTAAVDTMSTSILVAVKRLNKGEVLKFRTNTALAELWGPNDFPDLDNPGKN